MENLPVTKESAFYRTQSKWLKFWSSLTVSQRLYFTAMVLLLAIVLTEANSSQRNANAQQVFISSFDFVDVMFLCLILAALIIELWPRIIKFWQHTSGKAIAFVFYAFLANYALAHAAGTINQITGVSAEHFPYTHNLSLMLSIPTWFMMSTFMVLVIIPLVQPLYIMVLLLLRPFGLHKLWHKPDYRFPIITSLARMFLCCILSVSLILAAVSFGIAGGMNSLFKTVVQNFTPDGVHVGFTITEPANNYQQKTKTSQLNEQNKNTESLLNNNTNSAVQITTSKDDMHLLVSETQKRVENYDHSIKQILAYFIYELEADSYSRCQVTAGRRVIELNTYEILEIWPVAGKEKEYHFAVKPCVSPGLERLYKPTQP